MVRYIKIFYKVIVDKIECRK